MIRALPILAALPTLAACDLNDIINPGASSRAAYEDREAITTPAGTIVAQTPIPPTVEVAETAPEVVEVVVPEPVYVPPEPQKPSCQPVYAIFNCGPSGEVIWL
jgi:hypothetical protein